MKLILIFILLSGNFLFGQCPERGLLHERIIDANKSSNEDLHKKLKDLLAFENVIKNCGFTNDSTHAFLLQRIGAAYHNIDDYKRAITYTQQAINIISKNFNEPSIDYKVIIKDYYNLSIYYDSLDMQFERNKAVDSCVTIALKLKFTSGETIYLLSVRVKTLFNIGEYERCYKYADIGAISVKNYHDTDSINYVNTFLMGKVNVLKKNKNYARAESLLLNKLKDYKKAKLDSFSADLYERLAVMEFEKTNNPFASLYFKKSLKYHQQAHNFTGCLTTLNNLGYYIYFQGNHDYKNALESYKQALTYTDKSKLSRKYKNFETLNVLTNIANVHVKMNDFDSAFYYFQLAFDQIKPGFNEKDLVNNPLNSFYAEENNISYLVSLVLDKGDAFFKQYKYTKNKVFLKEAIRIYKIADQFLNKIKAEHSETQSKLYWRSNTRRLYEHAIEACYILNNADEAFYFFEKSRAVLLNDELNEQRWVGQDDISQQVQLKKKILKDQAELDTAKTGSARYAELQNGLMINKLELEKIQKTIKKNNPLYYQSFLDSSFITLKNVKQIILQGHQALIEIFTGDSAVYTLVITPQKSYITQVDKADFDATLNTYITHISNRDLLNRQFKIFKKASHHLYQLLFANIPLPAGRIIISPDGRNFPFEALIVNKPNEKLSYFLYDHAVSYTYSARYLLNQFNKNTTNIAKDFMGIAPVNYPAGFGLAALPGSINSLQQLQPYFNNANMFTRSNASKNNFLQNFSNYKIIQLYTHATDSSNKGEPAIYFADSVLHLSDLIPEHKPVTDLIVLSACNTGSGRLYQGEGVFSFNRAFAALGIPASVNNLWSADDQSTYRLTELFYKYLAEGLPTDIALQKAKIEFIESSGSKENALPYHWAATVLAGKTNTIAFTKPFTWAVLLLAIPIAGIALWKTKKLLKTKKV